MKSENQKFLEDNRHHWVTLRDAFFMRHLDGNTRENMRRVMCEEFVPGYTADLWCPPCVSEMVTSLYRYFESWEKAQIPAPVVEVPSPDLPPTPVVPEPATNPEPEPKPQAASVQVKANFPSHKKNSNR